jgi:hypothetical protein
MTSLRKKASGQECMIRLPGCSYNPEETVLAHIRTSGTGMSKKEPDLLGAWACRSCHDIVDGRAKIPIGMSTQDVVIAFYDGVFRTQRALIKQGIIKC